MDDVRKQMEINREAWALDGTGKWTASRGLLF